MVLNIKPNECSAFPGGWSVNPEQMYLALKHLTYHKAINVLEMGSGEGTTALVALLDKKKVPYSYTAYENDKAYASKSNNVRTIMWSAFPNRVVPGIFDLIIIDGPHGVSRIKWYPLLRRNVRKGTIIVVDDYRHYAEFKVALDRNFRYKTIHEHVETYIKGAPYVTWIVIKIQSVRPFAS
jgi:hypothetical protein